MTRSIALALILLASACASTPGDRGSREAAKTPLRGGVAELHVTSFDGGHLYGRVLLGATVEPSVMYKSLIEFGNVDLWELRACGKKVELGHYVFDAVIRPPRPEDLVTVRPGYWYGKNVHFFLFDKSKATEPDCFEAYLVVRAIDGRVAAKLPIRVVRTDKTSPALDGGTDEPKPPASDAGAP